MNWQELGRKLSSRKLWMAIAAFLASFAMSIAGLTTANSTVTSIGIVCGMLSAAIYAAAEAYVDAASASSTTEQKVTNVNANTTSKEVVAALTSTIPQTSNTQKEDQNG